MHIPVVSGWPGFLGFGILPRHSPSWRREGVGAQPSKAKLASSVLNCKELARAKMLGALTSSACSSVGILFLLSKRLSLDGSDEEVREKLEGKRRNSIKGPSDRKKRRRSLVQKWCLF